jgi:hypothetical protein
MPLRKNNDIVSSSVTNKTNGKKKSKRAQHKKSYYQLEKCFFQTQMYLQQKHDKQKDL